MPGMIYRETTPKDKLAEPSEEEKLALLASNGMFVNVLFGSEDKSKT